MEPFETEERQASIAQALAWLLDLLNQRQIECLICGGLAAQAYGAARPLNDIDLFVPAERFTELVAAGTPQISKPAKFYQEAGWQVRYVQFQYAGIKIEVGSSESVRIFDGRRRQWCELPIDFTDVCWAKLYGSPVPLMSKSALIAYKSILQRPVDQQDLAMLGHQ